MRGKVLLLGMVVILANCDRAAPEVLTPSPAGEVLRLEAPDPIFELSAEERIKVRPDFDIEALENLLRMIRPQYRETILRQFQWDESGRSRGDLVEMPDKALQEALEHVWAPYWDQFPASALDDRDLAIPGREAARARRHSTK